MFIGESGVASMALDPKRLMPSNETAERGGCLGVRRHIWPNKASDDPLTHSGVELVAVETS